MLAPAASASVTVSLSGSVLTISGDSTDNVVFETGFDTTTPWFTTPAPGTLSAGAGCTQLSANNVECPGTSAPTSANISLGAGDDLFLWSGTAVPLTIDGGSGDDELSGSTSADTISGGTGDDILIGFAGNDRLNGDDGNDVIDGSGGDDRIDGGNGVDKLNGDGEGDALVKQFGNDTIISRDAVADVVECEAGTDVVRADSLDTVADSCENVSRSAETDDPGDSSAKAGPGSSRTPAVNPPFVKAETPELTLTVRRARLPKLGAFADSSPIRLTVRASAACTATTFMLVSTTEAKRLRFRASRTLNRVTEDLAASTPVTVSVRASGRFRRVVRGRRSATVNLRVVCKPANGAAVTAKLAIRLKR